MEDQRLYEATIEGNVDSLLKLIQEDALTLHRNNTTKFLENPLHIAVLLGHEQFVYELLRLKPDLVKELDVKGSSPLHLASAKGNLEIVKACVRINPELCFVCNRDGKNPIHVAAMRGRVDVLRELMRVKPEVGRAVVERECKTILHLCVEYGQLEALTFLLESGSLDDLVNCKDRNGNTILHLAVSNKQVQITDFLLGVNTLDISAMNNNGMTAMDILMQRGRDIRDAEIEGSLLRARASVTKEHSCANGTMLYSDVLEPPKTLPKYKVKKPINKYDDWLERKKSALMIVASLIATMAFQVGVNPSSNAWNTPDQERSLEADRGRITYLSNLIYNYFRSFPRFYMVNTMSFIASLSIILLLMSGLPLKNKLFMWILMVITWIAITALALSYTISVILLTPPGDERPTDDVFGVTMFIWLCLMALLLIAHTARVIYRMLKAPVSLTWEMIKGVNKLVMGRRKVHTNRDNVRLELIT